MVADFSMEPAETTARLQDLTARITRLNTGRDAAGSDENRIQQLLVGMDQLPAPEKYGRSVVAAAELELLRNKVNALLRGTTETGYGGTTDIGRRR